MRSGSNCRPVNDEPRSSTRNQAITGLATAAQETAEPMTVKVRRLTVITRGRENGRVPQICMEGNWLAEAGFVPGSRCR
jgi:hypothetical protein